MSATAISRRVGDLEASSAPLMRIVPAEPVAPLPVEHPSELLAVLAEQINAVRADHTAEPMERARTIGMLASVALRVVEANGLAERLEAVEKVLKLRREQGREKEQRNKRRSGSV